MVAQIGEFVLRLDPFDHHRRVQRLADRLDRPEQALVARPLVDRGDERTVDLDLVGFDLGQGRQRRIADAEVVDRNLRADLAQHRRDLELELAGAQQRLLGQLDHEATRLAAGGEPVGEGAHEANVARLLSGDVEAEPEVGAEGRVDRVERGERLLEQELRHLVHQAEVDGEGDQVAGRARFAVLVAPAHQHFEPGDLAGAEIDLGLQRAGEAPVADGEAQALLQPSVLERALRDRRVVEASLAAVAALGLGQRRLGLGDQTRRGGVVRRVEADAGGGGEQDLDAVDVKGVAKAREQQLDPPQGRRHRRQVAR